MKFIHCSDLHLDSKMEALPPHKAAERAAELRLNFERLANEAEEKGACAVLIAGDMFDDRRVSAATVSFVLDVIDRTKNVDFLYLRGNHDESRFAFAGQTLPENLKLFSGTWQSYDYGEAVITGAEITGENCRSIYDELKLDGDRCNIVMLHGQVGTETGEDCVCLPLLRNRGIDYLALGHIHSYETAALDREGQWCYCGSPEGRGFDECGEKGYVLLTVDNGGVKSEFVPFAKRRLHNVPVDISGLETVTELREAMQLACAGIPKRDLVKFTLTGSFTPETQKDMGFLRRAFEDDFYFVKLKDESRLCNLSEDYIHEVSLKGAFVRAVMASDMAEEEKERVILLGLHALSGEEAEL